MIDAARYEARREREMRWHHGIQRYVTVGRKRDDKRCVWDVASGRRVSRWVRPERAETAAADSQALWRGGRVTLWIERMA